MAEKSDTSTPSAPPAGEPTNPEEHKQTQKSRKQKLDFWLDILSAIMLAVVAVATAWNSYQAARWSSFAGMRYGQASARRLESTRASTTAGQLTIIDMGLFTNWINAYGTENEPLMRFYEKRFREEFKPAFESWMATDPANNPEAPKSPFAMPEYQLAATEKSNQLEQEASALFEEGKQAIEKSTNYILNTVFLASVLFFIGIAGRFRWLPLRMTILIVAFFMLAYGLFNLVIYPKY